MVQAAKTSVREARSDARGDLVQTIASQERVDAAGAQPEERDRDRQECEVVVHDDREDARERELGHQQRGRDGRHGDEGA